MSPHNAMKQQEQQQQHEPWVTPAEIENAWRQALRSSTAHPSARGQQQQQQQLAAAALDGLYGALGPQEWLGYEGLLGLQQQQQCAGNSCSDGGGKPLPWPYDGKDVNAYKAKVTPELDAKLQRLYQRNVDWRRRCEMVYTRQRYSEMKEELQGCTFHPVINKKSEKLVQVCANVCVCAAQVRATAVVLRTGQAFPASQRTHPPHRALLLPACSLQTFGVGMFDTSCSGHVAAQHRATCFMYAQCMRCIV